MTSALMLKSPTGLMSSPTTRASDQRLIGGGSQVDDEAAHVNRLKTPDQRFASQLSGTLNVWAESASPENSQ